MGKYIKVDGLNEDYNGVVYELSPQSIFNLIEQAIQYGKDGGTLDHIGIVSVDMTKKQFEALEDVN